MSLRPGYSPLKVTNVSQPPSLDLRRNITTEQQIINLQFDLQVLKDERKSDLVRLEHLENKVKLLEQKLNEKPPLKFVTSPSKPPLHYNKIEPIENTSPKQLSKKLKPTVVLQPTTITTTKAIEQTITTTTTATKIDEEFGDLNSIDFASQENFNIPKEFK